MFERVEVSREEALSMFEENKFKVKGIHDSGCVYVFCCAAGSSAAGASPAPALLALPGWLQATAILAPRWLAGCGWASLHAVALLADVACVCIALLAAGGDHQRASQRCRHHLLQVSCWEGRQGLLSLVLALALALVHCVVVLRAHRRCGPFGGPCGTAAFQHSRPLSQPQ